MMPGDGFRYAFLHVLAEHSYDEGRRLIGERRYAEAEFALRRAELAWEHLGARYELLAVRVALGGLYAVAGRAEGARGPLGEGRQEAHRRGGAGAEARARVSLCARALEGRAQDETGRLALRARG